MKLVSITVGNFKNLAETKLHFGKIISLISINNYGKSNLLEAIEFGFDFIEASAKNRAKMMRWVPGIPLNPLLAGNDFVFELEFDEPELGKYQFVRYSFRFAWLKDENNGAVITDETLDIRENEHCRYTSYLKRDKGQYRAAKEKTGFRKISLPKDVLAIDILSSLNDIDISNVILKVKSLNQHMCNVLELNYSYKYFPFEFDLEDSSSIRFDDNDIPKALSSLKKNNPDKYVLFEEAVYDLFPEFDDIRVESLIPKESDIQTVSAVVTENISEEKKIQIPYHIKNEFYKLMISSKNFNQPISMEYMSTGTKRVIWLIASAIYGNSYGTNLIGVDEIETSIHPKMLGNLLELLTDILVDTSMIITSHSPYLIQYLKPEYIYVGVPNEDGIASFKRVQPAKVKTLLKASRELGTSVGEYLFELMSGDEDSTSILAAYLEK